MKDNKLDLAIPLKGKLLRELHLYTRIRPLERPRFSTKGGRTFMYQPKDNQKELFKQLEYYINGANKMKPIDVPVHVDTFIYYKKPVSSVGYDFPTKKNSGDLDNLEKAINDALVTHKILEDDKLIVGAYSCKAYDNEENFCSIFIYQAIWPGSENA